MMRTKPITSRNFKSKHLLAGKMMSENREAENKIIVKIRNACRVQYKIKLHSCSEKRFRSNIW